MHARAPPLDPAVPDCPVVLERREHHGRLAVEFLVPAGLDCLRGHFTIAAIVPGVQHLGWALGFARSRWLLPGRLAGVDGLKFRGVLTPGMRVTCLLERQSAGLGFRFIVLGRIRSSGRILFA